MLLMRINNKCNTRIQIDDQHLNEVKKYTYLGATVSKQGGGEEHIGNRVCKARTVFMKLENMGLKYILPPNQNKFI